MSYLNLRQVCLVAPELATTEREIAAIFGLEPCFRDGAVGKYGLENALFAFGTSFLEVVAPVREGTAAGRFLERFGGRGGYMAIFDCDDPVRRQQRAEALGVRLANRIAHPGYVGMQLHPRDCRAAMLEFDHTEGAQDLRGPYHPAGPDWQKAARPERVDGPFELEVSSPVPEDIAAHWSRITETQLQRIDGAPSLRFDLGEVHFVSVPEGAPEQLSAVGVRVGNPDAVIAAARARGHAIVPGGFELCGVVFRLRQ